MKIAKRDIAIVMVVLGAIILFISYKFAFSPSMDTVKEEEAKQADLQKEIDEIKKVAGTESQMDRDMKEWASNIETALKKYNPSYSYEDGLLWLKQVEEAKDTMGNTASGAPLIDSYTVSEIGLNNMSTIVEGQGKFAGTTYGYGRSIYTFDYLIDSYANLKLFLDYIVTPASRDGVKTIDSMTFVISNSGAISGTVNMSVYVLTNAIDALQYAPPAIDGVNQGVTNIFGQPSGEVVEE